MDLGNLLQIVVAVIVAIGGRDIITSIAQRRTRSADVADRLAKSTIGWAEKLEAQASAAHTEATAARQEATTARSEAVQIQRQLARAYDDAEKIGTYLRRLVNMIHDPYMTIDRLRAMVGDPGGNGGLILPEIRGLDRKSEGE